jgi:glycosyltransferase involved in cell wall biosynthesis
VQRCFGRQEVAGNALEFWVMCPFVWLARFSFIRSLKRHLSEHRDNYDVLHVHEAGWIAGAVMMAAEPLGIPVVCKEATCPALPVIGYDVPWRRQLADARRHAHFIAMNDAIRNSLLEQDVPDDHVHCIPNAVNIPVEAAKVESSREVVYVGNFSQGASLKAFDVLLDAWAIVAKQDKRAQLLMVGGGASEPWRRYAEERECDDRVWFIGRVDDVGEYYQRGRCFVLPSRVEGMSNALLEAMSWGLPPVVSDIPGNLAVVQDGENGRVVPVGRAPELADAILALLRDSEQSRLLGEKAREHVQAHFSLDHVGAELLTLYKQLGADA